MPQSNFDEIIEKYVEMNIAHPFRKRVTDAVPAFGLTIYSKTKSARLSIGARWISKIICCAMERSPIKDVEIKVLLKAALTDEINSREVYMKGIDHSYYYEGYTTFKTEEL